MQMLPVSCLENSVPNHERDMNGTIMVTMLTVPVWIWAAIIMMAPEMSASARMRVKLMPNRRTSSSENASAFILKRMR